MPKIVVRQLTDDAVASLVRPGFYCDGDGLYLQVMSERRKSWVLRCVAQRKRRDFGLGSVRHVSLGEARDRAAEYRKIIRAGGDPTLAKVGFRLSGAVSDPLTQLSEPIKPRYDDVCGVYFLYKRGALQYVGQSHTIFLRIRRHRLKIDFDKWRYVPIERENLDMVEAYYIHKLAPPLNRGVDARRKGDDTEPYRAPLSAGAVAALPTDDLAALPLWRAAI